MLCDLFHLFFKIQQSTLVDKYELSFLVVKSLVLDSTNPMVLVVLCTFSTNGIYAWVMKKHW